MKFPRTVHYDLKSLGWLCYNYIVCAQQLNLVAIEADAATIGHHSLRFRLWWHERYSFQFLFAPLLVIITIALNFFVLSIVILSHCSLRDNQLTDTEATALARGLKHNKSLKELK